MIPPADEILRRIQDGSVLPADVIRGLPLDDILDARDGDPEFETDWSSCYERIEAEWPKAAISPETSSLAEDVRRESFMAVSRATDQHEIASYVSDDFDLIVRGSVLGLQSPFLERLWGAYDRREIPAPAAGDD